MIAMSAASGRGLHEVLARLVAAREELEAGESGQAAVILADLEADLASLAKAERDV
jgi:hypothetical protein